MRILVTGGAGFIGSHIVDRLVSDGHQVRVVDNLSTGKIENLSQSFDRIEFVFGNLTDYQTCQRVVRDIDVVCHQAALGSVSRSIVDPIESHAHNTTAFLNLLMACKENGIRRVVYASSSAVYGSDYHLPKTEDIIGEPLSPYAVTKLVDELYASVFTRLYQMQCIGLRYFNVFGPRQDPDSPYSAVIPSVLKRLSRGESPIIYGDGSQTRGFTYIDNIVDANILALTVILEDYGKVFNIGDGSQISVKCLIESIQQLMNNQEIEIIYRDARAGDIRHSNASIRLAETILGYRPKVTFQNGLVLTVNHYKLNDIK